MQSNILVRGLAGGAVLVLGLVVALTGGGDKQSAGPEGLSAVDEAPVDDNGLGWDPLSDDVLKDEYGIDADSPETTLKTLTLETRRVRQESESLRKENESLTSEINRLLGMEQTISNRVDSSVDQAKRVIDTQRQALDAERKRFEALTKRLERKMAEVERDARSITTPSVSINDDPAPTARNYDIARADLPAGLGYSNQRSGTDILLASNEEVIWKQPLDMQVSDETGELAMPEFDPGLFEDVPLPRSTQRQAKDESASKIAKFTIPANSTLINATLMTTMIGRPPIGGQLVDPYPFRLVISGTELMATNGHVLPPNLSGIVMQGIAKGDWNLGCTTGRITSMTFTFDSGHIVTWPKPLAPEAQQNEQVELGWIADEFGTACVTGERVTNAPSYLATRLALSTAEGYAAANAQSQLTTQSNVGGGLTTGLTGDPQKYATNQAIADGVGDVSDWFDKRQSDSYDAIIVLPGRKVTVMIDKELALDIDPNGRRINHEASNSLAFNSLD